MKESIQNIWNSLLIIIAFYALISTVLLSTDDFTIRFPIFFFFGVVLFSLAIVMATEYYLRNILKMHKKAKPFASARKALVEVPLFFGDTAFIFTELLIFFQIFTLEEKATVFYYSFFLLGPVLMLVKRIITPNK